MFACISACIFELTLRACELCRFETYKHRAVKVASEHGHCGEADNDVPGRPLSLLLHVLGDQVWSRRGHASMMSKSLYCISAAVLHYCVLYNNCCVAKGFCKSNAHTCLIAATLDAFDAFKLPSFLEWFSRDG